MSNYHRELANFRATDTVVVGNGPAALFLSYILHGNVPRYDPVTHGPHPDAVLHRKLSKFAGKSLCDILDSQKACEYLTEHFHAANLSYSSQALPVNTLLDTLMRPNADTEIGVELKSRLGWDKNPAKRVDHIVLGSAPESGGQWTEEPISANWDIGTLSYAEMFTLPGYSFPEHYKRIHKTELPELIRPTRRDVASYYASYPKAVGISSAVYCNTTVQKITRNSQGFTVRVQRRKSGDTFVIVCKHLVLATGIFTFTIPPPPIFLPLLQRPPQFPEKRPETGPILVVGSGFTAADVILSQDPYKKIIHIYKWTPSRPSPLKGCHPQAYPEYAQIYRQMKLATLAQAGANTTKKTPNGQSYNGGSDYCTRDWSATYEGFPNAQVITVSQDGQVKILTSDDEVIERTVSDLKYCAGRKGSLGYLSTDLRKEVGVVDAAWVSADTMRRRVEMDLEVAPSVFVVGSLTGDSLVRYGLGSCVYAAGKIVRDFERDRPEMEGGIDRAVGMVVDKNNKQWGGCTIC